MFKFVGKTRLRDLVHKAKVGQGRPNCISEDCWRGLQDYWKSNWFKRKSDANKKNCSSNTGLHSGGSIPMIEHRKRLETKIGWEPKIDEIFLLTHQKRGLFIRL